MGTFNLREFQSTVNQIGLAEVNRFEMFINAPPTLGLEDARLPSLLCEITNFPPLNVFVKPLNIYGPAHQRPVSLDYGGDGLAASFYVDQDMRVKRFFEDWIWKISDPVSHNISYQGNYACDITIKQLNRKEDEVYEVNLIDAFPRSMNLMDLNNSAQNQVHRLTIVFAFRRWTTGETNAPAPGIDVQREINNLSSRFNI